MTKEFKEASGLTAKVHIASGLLIFNFSRTDSISKATSWAVTLVVLSMTYKQMFITAKVLGTGKRRVHGMQFVRSIIS